MRKNSNAWKRLGVAALSALLLANTWNAAFAEESSEEQHATLNIVDDSDADAEPETEVSVETETEEETETEPETAEEEETEKSSGTPIAPVESTQGSIVMTDVSAIVENCMPSIVAITNVFDEEEESDFYGTVEVETESTASGIIFSQNDEELLIATNCYTVSDSKELSVCFSVEAEDEEDLAVPAKLKGSDSASELAVVAVALSDIKDSVKEQLRLANMGSSADLKVGQAVMAVGNDLGYGQSVTVGIISTLNHPASKENPEMDVILTDASINEGNSGSALLNAAGEVIGICVAKKDDESAEETAYAVPIDTALPVLERLADRETRDKLSDAKRGYIGATVREVSEDAVESYGMPAGAFVYEVTEGSAAEEAGIQRGDIITKLEGETVTGSSDLIDKMSYYAPGETITLEVQTANNGEYEARDVEVTLQEGSVTEEEEEEAEESKEEDSRSGGRYEDDGEDDYYYDDEDGFDDFFDFFDEFDDGFGDYNRQFEFN